LPSASVAAAAHPPAYSNSIERVIVIQTLNKVLIIQTALKEKLSKDSYTE